MIRAAALAAVVMSLTGCDVETPSEKTERLAKRPHNHVEVFHDGTREVTCWKYGGTNGGISCLPDWMITKPSPHARLRTELDVDQRLIAEFCAERGLTADRCAGLALLEPRP